MGCPWKWGEHHHVLTIVKDDDPAGRAPVLGNDAVPGALVRTVSSPAALLLTMYSLKRCSPTFESLNSAPSGPVVPYCAGTVLD